MTKLSTESYKGVRDFYPKDQFIQNYIFSIMKKTAESFGYLEYGASILEPAELYRQKSGDEIVNEQTYTFKDRGDREVTLRPEMTPTVARMIASKTKELTFPARWYSIPNLFRYEKPQKGRLREHYQLNVDIFGIDSIDADIEIIKVANSIMKNFGAKPSDFIIKINSRKVINDIFEKLKLDKDQIYKISKIIDKKEKISNDVFKNSLKEIVEKNTDKIISILNSAEEMLSFLGEENKNCQEIIKLAETLESEGIENIVISPTLMRGFDYYTGIVFEVFDQNKDNNRSLFGGGRYDDLLSIFTDEKIPACGFGMGDVTAKDFLETHNLLPQYTSSTNIHICLLKPEFKTEANKLAEKLRNANINTSIDLTNKKIGDQIKYADKNNIPFIVCIGDDEIKNNIYKLKNLNTKEEFSLNCDEIIKKLKNA